MMLSPIGMMNNLFFQIDQVFNDSDTNKDEQLNRKEFKEFMNRLCCVCPDF